MVVRQLYKINLDVHPNEILKRNSKIHATFFFIFHQLCMVWTQNTEVTKYIYMYECIYVCMCVGMVMKLLIYGGWS